MNTEQQLAEIKDLVLQTHQRLEHLERKTDDITVQLKEVDNRFNEVDKRFNEVDKRFNEVDKRFNEVDNRFKEFDIRFKEFDIRIDTYQKASQQVVNLAFGLIVAATAAIVIPAITNR